MSRKFECVSNGADGWLIVSSPDLAKLGKNRSHFSNASLMSPTGEIALDHAGDALIFLRVWNAKFGAHEIVESSHTASEVEKWSPFGSHGIDAPCYANQADYNQAQSAAEVAEEERQATAEAMQVQDRAYHSQDPDTAHGAFFPL